MVRSKVRRRFYATKFTLNLCCYCIVIYFDIRVLDILFHYEKKQKKKFKMLIITSLYSKYFEYVIENIKW